MQPVTFPYDVRHDITFYGLKITKIWIPILGLVGSALLFAVDVPFLSVMFKLLLMALAPVALFVFFVFDMGQWIKRLRDFIKEPPLRLPDSRGKEGSVQSLIDVKARRSGGPFLDYKGGYGGVIMSVEPLPWEVMTEDDKTVEVSTFQAALSRALGNNMVVSIYIDFDLELPRVEIERKAMEWRTRFPVGSPLRSLAEARLAKFREDTSSFRPVKPVDHVRLLWKPTNRDLPRRPRDEKEKEALVAMAFSSLIETFTGNLSAGGIHSKVLGAEAARDMVSRQLNPADWRRVAPVANTDWESRLAKQPAAVVKEKPKTPGASAKEERAGRADTNLITMVTFEQGTETIPVTLELVDKLLQGGYSISLIDADIHSPGSLNVEFGVTGLPVDWRTASRAGEAALTPHKGLMYWGLSSEVFSVELSSASLWRVINEAGRWSHVTLVHLGENEAALANLIGKSKVVAVAGRDCPEMNTALKFSKAGARLVTLNEQDAQRAAKNYRVKKCLVLDRDIGHLVDFASGKERERSDH